MQVAHPCIKPRVLHFIAFHFCSSHGSERREWDIKITDLTTVKRNEQNRTEMGSFLDAYNVYRGQQCTTIATKQTRQSMSTVIMKGTKVQTLGVRAVAGVCMVHGWLLGP